MRLMSATIALAATPIWLMPHSSLASDRPAASAEAANTSCRVEETWVRARDGQGLSPPRLFSELKRKRVVMLGETHDRKDHHQWQLHTLAALHSHATKLVIGFEMFPRQMQPVLDKWIKGELSETAFLKAVDWRRTWGIDAGLYMPLFDFARLHRIPMVALNVDRKLVSKVGARGWRAVPPDEREGVSDPAPASPEYRDVLADVYKRKQAMKARHGGQAPAVEPKKAAPAKKPSPEARPAKKSFEHFVEAQLTWDRAMAERLAQALNENADAVIVGIMGSGHLSNFHGVPHQLKDLGIGKSTVLLPVDVEELCDRIGSNYADVLFTTNRPKGTRQTAKRLLLGVHLRDGDQAAVVNHVVPDSVAAKTDLRKGDRIVRAAGVAIPDASALIEVMSRQAPGTWLPLTIERSGSKIDLVAKFPARKKKGT